MNKFTINQTFTVTTDDQQQLTYTIKDIDETGRLLVHSSLLEKAYFVTAEAFEDFLRVIGYVDDGGYTEEYKKYRQQNPFVSENLFVKTKLIYLF